MVATAEVKAPSALMTRGIPMQEIAFRAVSRMREARRKRDWGDATVGEDWTRQKCQKGPNAAGRLMDTMADVTTTIQTSSLRPCAAVSVEKAASASRKARLARPSTADGEAFSPNIRRSVREGLGIMMTGTPKDDVRTEATM